MFAGRDQERRKLRRKHPLRRPQLVLGEQLYDYSEYNDYGDQHHDYPDYAYQDNQYKITLRWVNLTLVQGRLKIILILTHSGAVVIM